ncbi:hypothetical protein [Desulfoscipio geothermicus]|uniref:Uncharacterized protein n=1 Tax=Desulfoscipio geothermicus DSM 3669 TaxID=1121426 RepID=A0A1I6EGU3_9FIRM|nr:hypothetical protein [Desulfoscipio geothermicus]SFR16877.1 hypothetical protein SAMN05660706_14224 [Desulfoscipio geothermicus DSM 3669]
MELAVSCPTRKDMQVMESAVDVFLRTKHGAARNVMHSVLRLMMDKYRTDRMVLSRCCVSRNGNYVRVMAKNYITGRECPGCGKDFMCTEVSIVSIFEGSEADRVCYGCSCGEIFGRVEAKT